VISGNLELLERRLEDEDDRDILREAQEATELGAKLASRLLAFGRRQPLNPKPVDLNGLVRGMTDLLRRSLGETVRIETRLGAGVPLVLADAGQIENALLNLAINARDAMPEGGRLTVETALATVAPADSMEVAPGCYVRLTVADTGFGMPVEVRQRAFEPFFTTKGPGAGSGLGLSMVYGFVKQSGGHVELVSAPGEGTSIGIFLPVRDEDLPYAAEAPTGAAATAAVGREVVLIVEDDPRVRKVAVRRLKALGYDVLEADSGAAALALIDDGATIDILFSDVVMSGGMTGIELANVARGRRPGLRVVLSSGYTDPAMIADGQLPPGTAWLAKPYSLDQLETILQEAVAC